MKKAGVKTPSGAELRRLAVERLRVRQSHTPRAEAIPDPERLIQELQIHQIELELQNEELRSVRDELEASLARATDLYDFAPVGYVTVDASSTILEINLVGAAMLGKERARLVGQRFAQYVAAAARPAFEDFVGKLRGGGGTRLRARWCSSPTPTASCTSTSTACESLRVRGGTGDASQR